MECKDCPELIKRYGYCQVVEDWVEPQLNIFSFENTPSIVFANNG